MWKRNRLTSSNMFKLTESFDFRFRNNSIFLLFKTYKNAHGIYLYDIWSFWDNNLSYIWIIQIIKMYKYIRSFVIWNMYI